MVAWSRCCFYLITGKIHLLVEAALLLNVMLPDCSINGVPSLSSSPSPKPAYLEVYIDRNSKPGRYLMLLLDCSAICIAAWSYRLGILFTHRVSLLPCRDCENRAEGICGKHSTINSKQVWVATASAGSVQS